MSTFLRNLCRCAAGLCLVTDEIHKLSTRQNACKYPQFTILRTCSKLTQRMLCHQDGTPTRRSFQHLPSEIGAEEVRLAVIVLVIVMSSCQTVLITLVLRCVNSVCLDSDWRHLRRLRSYCSGVAGYCSGVAGFKVSTNASLIRGGRPKKSVWSTC